MTGAEPPGIPGIGAGLQHRMTREARLQTVAGEEFRLERQQAEQPLPQPGELPHAMLAPGPDLGGDIMHARDAERRDPAQQAQGEAGTVDRHYQGRPETRDLGHRLVEPLGQRTHARQHLQQSHHGELAHRE